MTQALLNLVINAHAHTPPGTPIKVDAVMEGDHLAFRVIDQGPGIEPALLPTVFDPFVTTKTKGAGRTSGLGLTVVKAVTEAQEGPLSCPAGRTERQFSSASQSIGLTDQEPGAATWAAMSSREARTSSMRLRSGSRCASLRKN